MKSKKSSKTKTTTRTPTTTKQTPKIRDYDWVVGLVSGDIRAKSFEVAHAKSGAKLVCGRARTVKWAGYKKKRIVKFIPAALYERRCKRCLHVLFPARRRGKR